MRLNYTIIVLAAAFAVVACSDSTTSPRIAPERSIGSGASPAFDARTASGYNNGEMHNEDFTIAPNGTTINVGGTLTVTFPRNSVCDPAKASYGKSYWDAPCTVITKPVTLHVTYGYVNGAISYNFSPELRF